MYSNRISVLVLLIILIHFTYEQDSGAFEVRDFSLNRPYASVFSTSNSHWHLTGNTLVTDRFIRLTSDVQSRAGGLWNVLPVPYADWEIHVQFRIHGENKNFFGDGLVIWYVREPKLTGPVFGYPDHFRGLGIFLDTYANNHTRNLPFHNYPFISAVVNNGSFHYDHDNDGVDINLAGCTGEIHNRETDSSIAIRYENDRLSVSLDIHGKETWTECFSIDKVELPTHYYLGFSAATGELSDNHDIISVRTFQLDSAEPRALQDRKSIVPSAYFNNTEALVDVNSKTSSWSALKIFLLIAGLIIVSVIGIGVYYYRQNRRRGPRFY